MNTKVFLEQSPQETLNIIEGLRFYRDNAVKPKFAHIIDKQLDGIIEQLNLQQIKMFAKEYEPIFKYGNQYLYEGKKVAIVGLSNDDEMIKIATVKNGEIEIIEVPIILLEKIEV